MPDPRVLLVGPALSDAESTTSLERLRHVVLPNATKYVVVAGKFDTDKSAKTFNAESGADYPAEVPHLHTLAASAGMADAADPRFRDAFDLFCLRTILGKEEPFDYAILLRGPVRVQERWNELRANVEAGLFLLLADEPRAIGEGSGSSVLFNLGGSSSSLFLDLLWDLFATGAAYAIEPYSFADALNAAADALGIQGAFSSRANELIM